MMLKFLSQIKTKQTKLQGKQNEKEVTFILWSNNRAILDANHVHCMHCTLLRVTVTFEFVRDIFT